MLARDRLNPGGVVLVNAGPPKGRPLLIATSGGGSAEGLRTRSRRSRAI